MTIPQLYLAAYHSNLHPNRVILQVTDRNRFVASDANNEEWNNRNLWCYSLLLPAGAPNAEQTAIEEFNRFFGVTATLEKQKIKCLLLVRKGNRERWKASHPDKEDYYLDSGNIKLIHNILFSTVADGIDYSSKIPVLDRTGIQNQAADMKLEGRVDELSHFRKELQKYDLDLLPAEEMMEVLVIRENKKRE